jgi:hypothetical protein
MVVKWHTIGYHFEYHRIWRSIRRRHMGNTQAFRGRVAPAIILAALVVVALVVALGMAAAPAKAQPTWSSTTCGTCHNYTSGDVFHSKAAHQAATCTPCHGDPFNLVPKTTGCGSAACHGSAEQVIAAKSSHVGCNGSGCHTAPTPTPTPTVTPTITPTPTPTVTPTAPATTKLAAKVAPTTVKVRKSVKVTGNVTTTPVVSTVGAKVAFKVERKVGAKWVKMKTGTATAKAAGAFTWSYKATKKGSHRVVISVAKTATFTAKSLTKTFRVK